MTKVSKSGDKAIYSYDALGRRIEKNDVAASTVTRYYYDGDRVIVETVVDGGETDSKYYVWGNYIDELVMSSDGSDDNYYEHDPIYSVIAMYKTASGL